MTVNASRCIKTKEVGEQLASYSLAIALLVSGCAARPDWIEATLVTADVTGTWRGRGLTLLLEQRGPKVTGRVLAGPFSGAVEGSVEGDVFRFFTANGALRGETTVTGDEMTGNVSGGYFGTRSGLLLRRGESPVPDSQPDTPKDR